MHAMNYYVLESKSASRYQFVGHGQELVDILENDAEDSNQKATFSTVQHLAASFHTVIMEANTDLVS